MKINTRTEYDSIKALRFSNCRALLTSPAHYKAELEKPREETDALRLGSAIHHLVLQPESFEQHYAYRPAGLDLRKTADKQTLAEFKAKNEGKTILDDDDAPVINGVSQKMLETINRLGIQIVDAELMLKAEYCGCPIKSAIDIVGSDGYIYDLKTTDDASTGWLKSVRKYKYALQSYFYRTVYELHSGIRPNGFRFIVTEKQPPYATAIYELGPNVMSYAIEEFNQVTKLYVRCDLLNEWPGFPEEPQVIDIGAPAKDASSISFA